MKDKLKKETPKDNELKKEAPKVFCKKENRDVPIWYCLGSFWQQRDRCSHNAGAMIHYGETAETDCRYPEEVIIETTPDTSGLR